MASGVSKGELEVWWITQETIAVGAWELDWRDTCRSRKEASKTQQVQLKDLTACEVHKQKGSWMKTWKT